MFVAAILSLAAAQMAQPAPAQPVQPTATTPTARAPVAPSASTLTPALKGAAKPAVTPLSPAMRFYSAADFKSDCGQPARIEACLAFGAAARDTSIAYQQWQGFQEFCIPANTSQSEIRDATLRYLNIHPRESDALAASVVILALRDSFPCAAAPAPGVITRP